jgi:2-polyprenyl-3-methyl-5-hydroxy-6-metoxy-1,4-benzoquinol methylase
MEVLNLKEKALVLAKGSSHPDIYAHVLRLANKNLKASENLSIIDVGCGKGSFLKILKEAFPKSNLTGCDLADYSSEVGEGLKWVQQDLNKEFSSSFEKYDLVFAIEVIEHIENPRHFIRELGNILKPGGLLVITTPNIESLTSIISFSIRGYHSAFGPKSYPAHITPVGTNDLDNILNELDTLQVAEQFFVPNGRIPGTGMKWKSLLPFLRGKRFSDNYITIIEKK